MKSYIVHLVRHGITEGNETGKYIGKTDLSLSSEGVRRLEALHAKNSYPSVQACFVSPLKRCRQTASILFPGAAQIAIDGFRECDFGAWEGKIAQEIAGQDADFARWISGTGKPVTPPGGENGTHFANRVCEAFEKTVEGMLRSGVDTVGMVVPGGALMAILSAYGLPRANFYDWMCASGCGYSLRITPGLWMRSKVAEAFSKLPPETEKQEDGGVMMIDLAREAADRAFGKKNKKENNT